MQGGNGQLIYGFLIAGFVIFFFTVLGLIFFKPFITAQKVSKTKKSAYIIVIVVLALVSVLFFGVSQFEYSRFFEYFQYSINFETTAQNFD
jgi:surface polysaccharide O-acyltransferase-like enzyme